jgi:phosphoglycerol transferase MdoB-like AlkP superfamily enzyme
MRKPDEYLPYKTYTDPLPLFMKRQGYDISFIGSAPLSFLHQGKYVQSMGFAPNDIYGDEKFNQYKKYAFWSAPDKIMVDHLLKLYSQKKKTKKPIFMVGQTITSHLPYNNSPYGTKESDSRKYADDAIGDLIV